MESLIVQQIEKVRVVGELVIVLMAIYFILKVFWINTEFVMTAPPIKSSIGLY